MFVVFQRATGCLVLVCVASLMGCGGGSGELTLSQQVQKARSLPNPEARGMELVRLAYKLNDLADVKGAGDALAGAQQAGQQIQDPVGRAKVLNMVAFARCKFQQKDQGRDALRDVETALAEIEDVRLRIKPLAKSAAIYGMFLDDQATGYEQLQGGEKLLAEIPEAKDLVAAQIELAYGYSRIGVAADAERLAAVAVDGAKAIADPRQQVEGLAAIAEKLKLMEQEEQANTVIAEAVAGIEKIEDQTSRAYALLTVAAAQKALGDSASANATFQAAVEEANEVKDASLRGTLLQDIDRQRNR